MTSRDTYSIGVPCRVDTFQPDPRAAMDFYGPLFGWTFDDPTPMPAGLEGDYFAARLGGRLVAGIGQAPPLSPAVWSTYVRVDDVAQTLARAEQAGGTLLAGPFGAGSDGRLAVLADATGVPFCLCQDGACDGDRVANEPNSWAMSSLHTTDIEQARAFYGALFDWELGSEPDAAFSLWRRAGEVVAVVTATDGVAVPPHWSVNFAVRDADFFAGHAVDLSGTLLMPPMSTPGFRSAVIRDPQGGFIAVSAPIS
ncbi:VOC family protein [Arthrobacter sp. ISL-65]|uniref:VOC family protein n=1 Tax=Arthrobacter sp. ISL-65 TaxID=2819112 RepID=UPI001BE4ECA6|nr:VOC family protein [Arthrobacter sp. ISL-65]MBT2549171.1 VOC family protein [Arthrobacter sp. ISL-65]